MVPVPQWWVELSDKKIKGGHPRTILAKFGLKDIVSQLPG